MWDTHASYGGRLASHAAEHAVHQHRDIANMVGMGGRDGVKTCAGPAASAQPRCGVASVMKCAGRRPQISSVFGS